MLFCTYTGDITRKDYEFILDNPKLSVLHFHWDLSNNAEYMMASHFITGFLITIEQLKCSNNTTTTHPMETKNLTLNVTLQPSQWYLLVGRILTKDTDTWGPEPVYKYFKTPGS